MSYPIDLNNLPAGFTPLASEPVFDPSKHLALEPPSDIYSLADLGYGADDIAQCPTEFGATSVFRVLSSEGAACLLDVCQQLEAFTTSNPRIARNTRGGVYRSAFLRDLCLSPDVSEFMSRLAGISLSPHTIPHQLGHLNYAPNEVGADVDKWHVDTLRYDYVMFVTDPTKVEGGAFQYFKGTKHEMAELKAAGKAVPADRVIAPAMPGPGYAIMQQGNMVVHQAKGLTAPGERITMVNGYVADPAVATDYTRYDQLLFADPPEIVTAEFARHVAVQAGAKLAAFSQGADFVDNPEHYAAQMDAIVQSLQSAVDEMRDSSERKMEHFGS